MAGRGPTRHLAGPCHLTTAPASSPSEPKLTRRAAVPGPRDLRGPSGPVLVSPVGSPCNRVIESVLVVRLHGDCCAVSAGACHGELGLQRRVSGNVHLPREGLLRLVGCVVTIIESVRHEVGDGVDYPGRGPPRGRLAEHSLL